MQQYDLTKCLAVEQVGKFGTVYTTSKLNEGGHGSVFIAKYKGTICVVKCMDRKQKKVFQKEVKLLHIVNNCNDGKFFPQLFGSCVTPKGCFIFMELFRRGDLMNFLLYKIYDQDTESDNNEQLVNIHKHLFKRYAADICLGIKQLHDKNMLHLDLKPENIMLTDDPDKGPSVVIIDFGLSKMKDEGETMVKSHPTTENYTPPEVYSHNMCGDPADLWSLGIILYLMFEGRFPFDGRGEILDKNCLPPFSVWQDDCTKELIKGLLDRDPKSRLTVEAVKEHSFFKELGNETQYFKSTQKRSLPAESQSVQPIKKQKTKN